VFPERQDARSNEHSQEPGRLALRPTRREDLDCVIALERDGENAPYIRQWSLEQHQAALDDPNISHQIVETVNGKHMMGYLILIGCVDPDRSLQLKRIVIAHKGYGLGRQAIRLVKAHAFGALRCHRLWLEVTENNNRAHGLYESEGFEEEGILREALRRGDHYVSLTIMSMLDRDYIGASEELRETNQIHRVEDDR